MADGCGGVESSCMKKDSLQNRSIPNIVLLVVYYIFFVCIPLLYIVATSRTINGPGRISTDSYFFFILAFCFLGWRATHAVFPKKPKAVVGILFLPVLQVLLSLLWFKADLQSVLLYSGIILTVSLGIVYPYKSSIEEYIELKRKFGKRKTFKSYHEPNLWNGMWLSIIFFGALTMYIAVPTISVLIDSPLHAILIFLNIATFVTIEILISKRGQDSINVSMRSN